MSVFGGLILTNKGRNLQAKAEAGALLQFNRIGIGDGNLGGSSILELNALINEKKSLAIAKLKPMSEGQAAIGTVLQPSDVVSGFYFRELGLFAQDPDEGEILYCYGNAGVNAEYLPADGSPDVIEKYIDIIAIVGNASSVSAVINQSLIYETPEQAQEKADAAEANAKAYTDTHSGLINNPHSVTAVQVGAAPLSHVSEVNNPHSVTAEQVGATPAAHATDLGNPHGVTYAQVGAESPEGAQSKSDTAEQNAKDYADAGLSIKVDKVTGKVLSSNDFTDAEKIKLEGLSNYDSSGVDSHMANISNPHSVTAPQVGLGSVQNYGVATQLEAETGTSDVKYMTPLKVKQSIDSEVTTSGEANKIVRTDNSGQVITNQILSFTDGFLRIENGKLEISTNGVDWKGVGGGLEVDVSKKVVGSAETTGTTLATAHTYSGSGVLREIIQTITNPNNGPAKANSVVIIDGTTVINSIVLSESGTIGNIVNAQGLANLNIRFNTSLTIKHRADSSGFTVRSIWNYDID